MYNTDLTVNQLEDNVNGCDDMCPVSNFKSVEVQTDNYYSDEEILKNKIKILQQKLRRTKNHVFNSNIFKNLSCEDDSFLENHILNLVTLICKLYLKIRLHYAAKLKTATTVSKRHMLSKLILFHNQ